MMGETGSQTLASGSFLLLSCVSPWAREGVELRPSLTSGDGRCRLHVCEGALVYGGHVHQSCHPGLVRRIPGSGHFLSLLLPHWKLQSLPKDRTACRTPACLPQPQQVCTRDQARFMQALHSFPSTPGFLSLMRGRPPYSITPKKLACALGIPTSRIVS